MSEKLHQQQPPGRRSLLSAACSFLVFGDLDTYSAASSMLINAEALGRKTFRWPGNGVAEAEVAAMWGDLEVETCQRCGFPGILLSGFRSQLKSITYVYANWTLLAKDHSSFRRLKRFACRLWRCVLLGKGYRTWDRGDRTQDMGTSTEQTKDAKTVSPAIRANEHFLAIDSIGGRVKGSSWALLIYEPISHHHLHHRCHHHHHHDERN
uniref:HDC05913 n=1 Tax=Drosophila melanogaster TaxID=7227 RepID=Q6IGL9_DROME|nr:TPA_inf: HDC05913 [Drosophila melanogaster]